MFNKIIKLCLITLVGATFFTASTFVVYASDPNVSTDSVTNVTSTTATLNGSIDFNNLPTNIWFEYGTNRSLNNSLPVNAYRINPGYSDDMIANVSGLNPNTTYYFRAVAQNSDGRDEGSIRSFTTSSNYYYNYTNYSYPYNYNNVNYVNNNVNYYQPFSINTEPASLVGNTYAQLNSFIYNEPSNYSNTWFEWGTTTNLGNRTSSVSTGASSVKHINAMTGLSPGTTYYFRAVAQNSFSTINGSILSFTTGGIKPSTYSTPIITYTDIVTETKTPPTTPKKIETTESSLGASVAGFNSFFPISLLGWLILLILILVLMLLGKILYRNFSYKTIEHTQEHI